MHAVRTGIAATLATLTLSVLTACSLLGSSQTAESDSKPAEPTVSVQKNFNSDRPLRADDDPEACDRHTNTVGFDPEMPTGTTTGYVDCLTEGTEIVPVLYVPRDEASGTYYKLVSDPLQLDSEGRFSFSHEIPPGIAPGTAASLRFVAASGPDLDQLLQAPAAFAKLPANAEYVQGIKLTI
jgi:hypothetical protein